MDEVKVGDWVEWVSSYSTSLVYGVVTGVDDVRGSIQAVLIDRTDGRDAPGSVHALEPGAWALRDTRIALNFGFDAVHQMLFAAQEVVDVELAACLAQLAELAEKRLDAKAESIEWVYLVLLRVAQQHVGRTVTWQR
jgi:hypothetical protein